MGEIKSVSDEKNGWLSWSYKLGLLGSLLLGISLFMGHPSMPVSWSTAWHQNNFHTHNFPEGAHTESTMVPCWAPQLSKQCGFTGRQKDAWKEVDRSSESCEDKLRVETESRSDTAEHSVCARACISQCVPAQYSSGPSQKRTLWEKHIASLAPTLLLWSGAWEPAF